VLHFAELAARARGSDARAFIEPLFEEARAAGLSLGARAPVRAAKADPGALRVAAALDACATPDERVARALEVLCEHAAADGGWLYLVGPQGALELRATRHASAPDAHAQRFARGYFEQAIDDAGIGEAFTQTTEVLAAGTYVDVRGAEHRVLPLRCADDRGLVYAGLAVLNPGGSRRMAADAHAALDALAACLVRGADSAGRRPEEP
jgi:hypothetical protein